MSVDNAFSTFEMLLTEEVEPNVYGLELPGDDVAWSLMDTFPAVSTAGRTTGAAEGSEVDGYESSWRIRLQRAGRVTGASWGGNSVTKMGPNNLLNMGQQVDDLYLDPVNTPSRSYAKIKMLLKKLQGSLVINRAQMEANLISDPLEDVTAGYIEDAVFQVREMSTGMFWSAGHGVWALVNGSGQTITEASITQITIDNGSPFRFTEGQRYVASSLSSGVPTTPRAGSANNPGVFRCVSIDTDARTVGFQSEPGEGTITLTDNDGIIPEGIYLFAPATDYATESVETLLPTTGNYPGTSYDVATHKHLKAYIVDNTSSPVPPTPELIAGMCDKITDPGLEPPTTLVAERSIWTYYSQLERASGAVYQVPQGAPFTASGGVAAPVIQHGTYTFAKLASSKCREATIYGLAPETWRRFMPGGGKTIRWNTTNGGIAGAPNLFHPIFVGRQMSRTSSAEFDYWVQFGQTNPRRNFIIKGVLSQRVADAA